MADVEFNITVTTGGSIDTVVTTPETTIVGAVTSGAPGADGAAGSQGPAGNDGAPGADGTDGATWYSGSGAPDSGLGLNGDFYFDTATDDVYQRGGGGLWSVIANIKGSTGNTGPQGPAGDDGVIQSVVAGTNVSIDNTDPANPIFNVASGGDVVGPASSTDNAITRFDSTTGKIIQNSAATVDDDGNINVRATGTNIFTGALTLGGNTNGINADLYQFRAGTNHAWHGLYRAKGTLASPTDVAVSDTIGSLVFGGYNTLYDGYYEGVFVRGVVDYVSGSGNGISAALHVEDGYSNNLRLVVANDSTAGTATGYVRIGGAASTPTITATGAASNSLNLKSTGAGTVQANGIQIVDLSTAQTLTNKTLTTPVISANITVGGNTVTFPGAATTIVGRSTTDTLTNKRITKRVSTTASSATPTPNGDTDDMYTVTALAAGATFGAPTGTPTEGQTLIIRIKDNGTARALSWNAIYRPMGVALPTTTFISKTMYCGFVYNSTDTKWDLISLAQEA